MKVIYLSLKRVRIQSHHIKRVRIQSHQNITISILKNTSLIQFNNIIRKNPGVARKNPLVIIISTATQF